MDTIFRDLSRVWMLLHNVVMFMLLYESRYPRRKTNIITGIFVIPLLIANVVSFTMLSIEKTIQAIIFICVLPSLIFFFIMAKNRDTRFLFTFCVVDTIVIEVLFATNIIDTVLGFGNYIVMFILRLVALPVIEFCIVKYIRAPYHILQQNMKKGWGVFSMMAALFYVVLLVVTYYPSIILDRPEYFPHLILILILVPVMYITVFSVLWKQLALFRAEEKNRVLSTQMKLVNERLAIDRKTENQLKIIKHDIRHKMILLNDHIKNRRFDEAEEYIKNMTEDINKTSLRNYCENNSVNVVLSHYGFIAEEKGILFETYVKLPVKLEINEIDLAVVLSNALENAINALEYGNDKRIIIKCFTEHGKLYLEIKNPFNGDIFFEDKLPKSSKENHGYGTKSIAAIIENSGGIYSFVTENGYFVFRCAL